MRHEELFALLALKNVEGVGDVLAKKLLSHFGSARAVFESGRTDFRDIEGIGPVLGRRLNDRSIFRKAEQELRFIESSNIDCVGFFEEDYPERLLHCPDGPVLLFRKGNIDLSKKKIVSIVGTRNVTPAGIDFCRKLVADLAPLDPVIVSGFAYGVDIVAHQAAVENNLQTIAILAHGLNQTYPKPHRKYEKAIMENGGFMTEFFSSSCPERENFVRRNRIVAGMSEATVIVESAEKGGSLITANLANDYNREVFAVPGRTTDVYSQGCNQLIKTQRAHLLTQAADLVYILNWDLGRKQQPVQKQLFVSLAPEEEKIYGFLSSGGKQLLDDIALHCGMPVSRLSAVLLSMELKGVARPLPGKLFEAV